MNAWIAYKTDRTKTIRTMDWLAKNIKKILGPLRLSCEVSGTDCVRLSVTLRWGHHTRYGEYVIFNLICTNKKELDRMLNRRCFKNLEIYNTTDHSISVI